MGIFTMPYIWEQPNKGNTLYEMAIIKQKSLVEAETPAPAPDGIVKFEIPPEKNNEGTARTIIGGLSKKYGVNPEYKDGGIVMTKEDFAKCSDGVKAYIGANLLTPNDAVKNATAAEDERKTENTRASVVKQVIEEHAAAHRVEQGDHRLVDEREVLLGNRASAHLLEVRHCRIAVEDAPRGLLHAGRDIAKHAAVQVLDFGVNERHHVRNLVDDGDVAPHHAVVLLDDSPDYVICLVKTVSNFSLASSAGIDMCFHQSFFHLTPLVWYPFCRKFIYPGNF